jgi:hypothetical protein
MNTDRIEPTIDHEFTLDITSVIDRDSGAPMLQFMFRTVREFSTFGYAIAIKDASKPSPTEYAFELGGLSLPSNTNHSFGGAQTIVMRTLPIDGTYPLTIRRRTRQYTAQLHVVGGAPTALVQDDAASFIRVEVLRA